VIAANGTATGDSYGCINSMFVSASPTTSETPGSGSSGSGSGGSKTPGSGVESEKGEKETLTFPSSRLCLSARRFQIHLREPKYDPFKTVSVTIAGHKLAVKLRHAGYAVATINLKGLKQGRFTVAIHVTTVLGHHLSGTRTYHTCAKRAIHGKPGKLH
ncbi:MAG TPA: hypothetical protein VK765_07230, partial [Solirubrobacteraceae bacterium]|nr:hypothetical protein [Solirubrobacteraceae bacterium]